MQYCRQGTCSVWCCGCLSVIAVLSNSPWLRVWVVSCPKLKPHYPDHEAKKLFWILPLFRVWLGLVLSASWAQTFIMWFWKVFIPLQKEGFRSSIREEFWGLKSQIFNVKYESILEFPKGCGGSHKRTPCFFFWGGGVWGTPQSVVRYQQLPFVRILWVHCAKQCILALCCRELLLIKDVELNHNGEKILEKLVRRHN